jgi:hypothetical protein
MSLNYHEDKPSFTERAALSFKRLVALGFFALAGSSAVTPAFTRPAADLGLLWAGTDIVHKHAKDRRLNRGH